jgi:murein L,D-transpeptidase YcbB/YkuD
MISGARYFLAATALTFCAPLSAQDSPFAATNTSLSSPPSTIDSAVDGYYASHPGTLLWLGTPDAKAAASKLPEILKRAPYDGLENGPQLAAAVSAALASGQPNDDKIISDAWVRYVRAIKAPVTGVDYADPALALKTPSPEQVLGAVSRAPSLSAYVDETAAVNPLYSALRDEAAKAGGTADPRIAATLNRLRLLPAKGKAVIVNIPDAKLLMIEDGRVVDSMKVIVGKTSGATPVLASTIYYVTFNPYWHIPPDIARVRVAPVVLKRGVKYLTLARYQTVEAFGGDKEKQIDPTTVDWKAVQEGTSEVFIRQLAGPQNNMGRMKIGFANSYGVFLHDTPKKELFAKDKRFLSHGCIRLEQPEKLASWLLGRDARPPSDDSELNVLIDKGVPIYLSYLTAQPTDTGTIAYATDVYGLDTAGATKAIMATAATAQ